MRINRPVRILLIAAGLAGGWAAAGQLGKSSGASADHRPLPVAPPSVAPAGDAPAGDALPAASGPDHGTTPLQPK